MSRGARLLLLAACLAGAATFGVTAWRLIDSPLRFDETDFIEQARGIVRHGVPKILYAETRRIPTPVEVTRNGEAQYGMWHPPLYQYSLASFQKFLGQENWVVRTVGLVWFALTAAIIWKAAGRQYPPDPLYQWLPLSIALLSPLVAQGIFFIDIDNTSLAAALVLFAAVFTAAPHDRSARRTVTLSFILLLALWSKLTTPFVLLVALGAYHVLDRDWRGVGQAVAIGVMATAAFAVTYLAYCWLTDYPADFMFNVTYFGKRDAYLSVESPGDSLIRKLHAIWWTVVWFSPALTLLLLMVTAERAWRYVRQRCLEPIDFWLVFSWACFGAYAVWGAVMGKYTFPAAVSAAVAIGFWFPARVREVRFARPVLFLAAAFALLVFHVTTVPALEVKVPAADVVPMTLGAAIADPRNLALALTLGGFATFLAIAYRSLSGGTSMSRVAALLLTCAVVANTVGGFKLMLSPDDRSPYRPFRERGFEAMVEALNQQLAGTDTLIAPKDVGFYYRGPSYSLEATRDLGGPAVIVALIRTSAVSHAADSMINPALPGAVFLGAGLSSRRRIDDYVIYGPPK
jgi:hypothetical protein